MAGSHQLLYLIGLLHWSDFLLYRALYKITALGLQDSQESLGTFNPIYTPHNEALESGGCRWLSFNNLLKINDYFDVEKTLINTIN